MSRYGRGWRDPDDASFCWISGNCQEASLLTVGPLETASCRLPLVMAATGSFRLDIAIGIPARSTMAFDPWRNPGVRHSYLRHDKPTTGCAYRSRQADTFIPPTTFPAGSGHADDLLTSSRQITQQDTRPITSWFDGHARRASLLTALFRQVPFA
jgi:hypothetical protein